MGGTRFMVQWEEHPSHLATRLGQLLEHQTLVDVTLMCNTHTLRVHRAVLAACSPYFETILQRQLGMHPLIVLKDMQFSVLKSLIEFMYCGETSVTEDNLGALLQAAKFFQVKGLSAMTKEALGLVPNAKSTINGDAARKAFVGRPKRVGMQQTFVTSGLKSVPASHASSSHTGTASNELPTLPTKTTFQTISKPITARPDTQQQTDTAQLLLSLSGSEFPKQTFHTVSKNVRFQHNVSGSAVSVESPRSSNIDSNTKAKEVVGRIPVMTPNGGKSTTTATATVSQQSGQIVEHATVGSIREDVLVTNPQSVFVAEGHRRRGRPVKRQMNMLFQERVMTDADAALHKEAEASRKALEMLRQEMSSETLETNVAASSNVAVPVTHTAVVSSTAAPATVGNVVQISNVSNEHVQKGLVKHGVQSGSKLQVQSIHTPIGTTSRTVTATHNVSNSVPIKKMNTNIVYKTSNNAVTTVSSKKSSSIIPTPDNTNCAVNTLNKVEEPEIPQAYEMPNEVPQEPPKEENVEYQASAENVEGETDINNGNTNIVYQMADSNNAAAGSVMSQYMEVLKEAGLPTDVPILLDSGDGSYVTVNEEVLMNIVNGGVLQCHVTEGNFVAGEGVEFIVQEITEDEMEAVQAHVQEQSVEGGSASKEMETNSEISNNISENENIPEVKTPVEEETHLISECVDTGENAQIAAAVMENTEPSDVHSVPSEILESGPVDQQTEMIAEETNASLSQEIEKTSCVPEEQSNIVVEADINTNTEIKNNDCAMEVENQNNNNLSDLCTEEVLNKENIPEDVKSNSRDDEMSVEQALQAMMGEGSDTEAEACTNEEVESSVKDESVVPGLETVSESLSGEKSDDLQLVLKSEEESEEDLHLVLSNDGGDATDNSNSYTVESTDVADHKGGPLVPEIEENSKLSHEVTAALSSDTDQVVGVHESVETVSRDAPMLLDAGAEEANTASLLGEIYQENENAEFLETTPGNEISGENQEVSQLTSNTVASSQAGCNSTEYPKSKGAIISPSKDIPFAVGLLPLKTALEKLQAMPEYHPRKTRSSSTGKESAPDMPAARVKRKASASEGMDKRFKTNPAEEIASLEQPIAEEPFEGDTTMEVVASSIPEEKKEETMLSMPELVTEPTEG